MKGHLLTAGQSNKVDILVTFKQLSWVILEIFTCLYNILKCINFYVDLSSLKKILFEYSVCMICAI